MIDAIQAISNALGPAGCTQVLYESDKLASITMDETLQAHIVGLIIEPNEITLDVKANAILENYPPFRVEILQQIARVDNEALNNLAIYETLLIVVKKFLYTLIENSQLDETAMFKKILPVTIVKVIENKYDAHVIGWAIPLNMVYMKNENKCDVVTP